MALTITPEITGQVANSGSSYSYLFEPLRVLASESTTTAKKIFIDLVARDGITNIVLETLVKYAEFDLNSDEKVSFDLMEIARQHRNSNTYKFANVDDMIGVNGFKSIVGEFRYNFNIYSDVNATPVLIQKLLLIGGREFEQFTPSVSNITPINEFQFYGIVEAIYEQRWGNVSIPKTVLKAPGITDLRPTLTKIVATGDKPCGEGFLIWKSRFGGWMWWGFDMKRKNYSHQYSGNLEVGMFESTKESAGDPYIPVDYTGISSSYSITLKSIGLTSLELKAVSGIKSSPAVYFLKPGSENVELMRLTGAETPLDVQARGGDFSVTLQSISTTNQPTI